MRTYSTNFTCAGNEYNATIQSSYPQDGIEPDLFILQENVAIAIGNRKKQLGLTGKNHFVLDAIYTIDGQNWISIDIKAMNIR